MNTHSEKGGIRVLLACLGITLLIGVLYAWSVIKKALVLDGWTNSQATFPYTVAIVVFAIALLIAGILQDKIGPKKVIVMGGLITGIGLLLSSFFMTPIGLTVTFGVVCGTGIGFGYGCATPPALKWFHPSKKGLVSGIVVAGFGLASVYYAPLATSLIENFGISQAFLILGIVVIALSIPLGLMITNPPEGYVPAIPTKIKEHKSSIVARDYHWKEMIKTPQFYLLWGMFLLGSSAGLIIIGNIASIVVDQGGIQNGAIFVSLLSIFNATGRVGGGIISDKIGRLNTLLLMLGLQMVNMVLFPLYTTPLLLLIGTAACGIAYGALLSIFPTTTADYYGMKNLGANYGVLYTAWGLAGVTGPVVAAKLIDSSGGSYNSAFYTAAALVAVAVILRFFTKPVK